MKVRFIFLLLLGLTVLSECSYNPNGPPPKDYPYYLTEGNLLVKNIDVPAGTKLVYEEQFLKKGKQEEPLDQELIHTIQFPSEKHLIWGGVPIKSIHKFYNDKMIGYTIEADFSQLESSGDNSFSALWKRCDENLGVDVKNIEDWSFNQLNILDIRSCGVNYQRYYEDDATQQEILDSLLKELRNVKQD